MERPVKQVVTTTMPCPHCGADTAIVLVCQVYPDNTYSVREAYLEDNERPVNITVGVERLAQPYIDYLEAKATDDAERAIRFADTLREFREVI